MSGARAIGPFFILFLDIDDFGFFSVSASAFLKSY